MFSGTGKIKLSIMPYCLSLAISMMYGTGVLSYVNALFLKTYPVEYLGYYYASAAFLYILISRLTSRYFIHHTKKTMFVLLFSYTVIIACAWQWNTSMLLSVWQPFIFCIFLITSSKFLMQSYWNVVSKSLAIREFKNNSNILAGAIAIGGILMGLSGPFIIRESGIIALLPTMAIFLVANMVLLYTISIGENEDTFIEKTGLQPFHYQYKLQKLLIPFAIMTLIFSTLVDYIFKYQIGASFGSDRIAIYSAKFYSLSYFLAFLVEIFYLKKVLQKFGFLTFLLQVPFLLIAVALVVAFKPNLITITLLWVTYNIVNLSILDIAFQLLGNALPAKIRGISKLNAKGIGSFLGALIASAFIMFLAHKATPTSIAIIFIACMAGFTALIKWVVKAYNQSLEYNLKQHHILNSEDLYLTEDSTQWEEVIQQCFLNTDSAVKLIGYELLGKKRPIPIPILDKVCKDLNDNNSSIRIEAAKVLSSHMNEKYFTELKRRIEIENESEVIWWLLQALMGWRKEEVLSLAKKYENSENALIQAGRISVLIKFGNIMEMILALNRLVQMINSPDPIVRRTAIRILSLFDLQGTVDSLSELIIDPDTQVSITAIQAALEHPQKEYIPHLIQQMGVKNISYYAGKALFSFGEIIIPVLSERIHAAYNPIFYRAAIRCIASIQGELAENSLIQLISHDNTVICNSTIKAIAYRALSIDLSKKFLRFIKEYIEIETERVVYYKQLLQLTLTQFEKQEVQALLYGATYRILYLFCIDVPQKTMPLISLILQDVKQGDFSNLFQEKVELLDSYLQNNQDRLFLSKLFEKQAAMVHKTDSLLSSEKLGPWLTTVFSVKSLRREGAQMHNLEKLVVLRGCTLFKDLSADILLVLAEHLEVILMANETILFKEGDLPGDLYIVAEGEIGILHGSDLISRKQKFDFIGELSILDEKPRTASAVAMSEAVVLKMSKIEYDRILDDFPDILRTIAQTLLGYLRQYQS